MIVLVRVDERLIHGQVVVGWRGALDPTALVVVDDGVAASDWERELVMSGVPDGLCGEVVTVSAAAAAWETWRQDAERRLVLVQSVHTVAAMIDAGIALGQVNMGGLHKRPGRREFLAYVYLDDAEVVACRRLCAAGVRLEARNVPGAGAVDFCRRLLSQG